jgi:chromosome condensin MukBEF MukE localization factor
MAQVDDDASVLAKTIDRDRSVRRIAQETGLGHEQVRSSLARMRRRGLVRHLGGGYWIAEQRGCARCSRSLSGGDALIVDPETLRWLCEECFEGDVAALHALLD